MKPARLLFGLLPIVLAGCGGGGGNPGPGTPDVSQLADVRVDAILASSRASIDATNVFPGESVRFRLTGIATGGARQYVDVAGFTTDAPAAVGTITSAGIFAANGASDAPYTVRTTLGGVTYSGTVRVVNPVRVLTGRVRLVTGAGAPRVGVRALSAAGAVVATGFSTSDGTVRLAAPPAARRLTLDFSSVDPNGRFYVRQFAYAGIDYSTVVAGCTAPLPDLSTGTTVALQDLVVYSLSVSSPPPPPDGCNAP